MNIYPLLQRVFQAPRLWTGIEPCSNFQSSKFNKYKYVTVDELDIETKIEQLLVPSSNEWGSLLDWFDRQGCSFTLELYKSRDQQKEYLPNWLLLSQVVTNSEIQQNIAERSQTKIVDIRAEEGFRSHWHWRIYCALSSDAAKRKYCINLSKKHLQQYRGL